MKAEFLKGLGLEKEAIDKIMAENSSDVAAEQAKTAAKEGELEKANETIISLKDTVKQYDGKDPAKLEADLTALQTKYAADTKAIKTDYESKITNMAVDAAIEKALSGSKAKHPDLISGKFDREKITVKDGTVTGVDEQLKALKDTYKDLFEERLSGNPPANPDAGGAGGAPTFDFNFTGVRAPEAGGK